MLTTSIKTNVTVLHALQACPLTDCVVFVRRHCQPKTHVHRSLVNRFIAIEMTTVAQSMITDVTFGVLLAVREI